MKASGVFRWRKRNSQYSALWHELLESFLFYVRVLWEHCPFVHVSQALRKLSLPWVVLPDSGP